MNRSEKASIVFSVTVDRIRTAYMGASSYELPSVQPQKHAYLADFIFFGDNGPTPNYDITYKYDTPNAELVLFTNISLSYADKEFYNFLSSKCELTRPFTLRINK